MSVTTEHWTPEIRNLYAVRYANGVLRNQMGMRIGGASVRQSSRWPPTPSWPRARKPVTCTGRTTVTRSRERPHKAKAEDAETDAVGVPEAIGQPHVAGDVVTAAATRDPAGASLSSALLKRHGFPVVHV